MVFDIVSNNIIAGVDEVGRGSWAGPVVSAAVVLGSFTEVRYLKDSKKLSRTNRHNLFNQLRKKAFLGIGFASVDEIERLNILKATFLSMQRAISSLTIKPEIIMIDGPQVPKELKNRAIAIVKGDQLVPEISAASIVAKVVRDDHMALLNNKYPGYFWDRNVGYGVKAHFLALKSLGITPSHRRSFKPIHNMLYKEN